MLIFFQATVDYADEETFFRRLLGHMMLEMVPDEGFDEALISLKDIVEFYWESYQPALPAASMSRTGRVTSVGRRPDLEVSD